MPPTPNPDLPTLVLKDDPAWSSWLSTNACTSPGVWLTLAKKSTTHPTTLTLAQALDSALCHGWINGQGRSSIIHPGTTIARFTPRSRRSTWSKINVAHVERLAGEGRMQARGWEEVERAKADGRWEAAYDGSVPGDLEAAVRADEGARGVWVGLGRGERRQFAYRLVGVRTEEGRRKAVGRIVRELAGRDWSGGEAKVGVVGKRKRDELEWDEDEKEVSSSLARERREQRAARRSERGGQAGGT